MLLPGHKALLKSTLSRLSEDELWTLLGRGDEVVPKNRKRLTSLKNEKFKTLLKGLYYPDLPCASRTLRNGMVTHDKLKLCSLKRLLLFSANDHLHEAYASHNGSMAYLHAMAPTPIVRVRDVRDSVVRQLLLLFAAGVRDDTTKDLVRASSKDSAPNIFWLGQALHVLMDSYSPAHTLRMNSNDGGNTACIREGMKQMKDYARDVFTTRIPDSDKLAMCIYDATLKLSYEYVHSKLNRRPDDSRVEDWLMNEVERLVLNHESRASHENGRAADVKAYLTLQRTRARVIDAFEVFVFEASNEKKYGIAQALHAAATTALQSSADDEEGRDIMCFFNYNTQSKLLHTRGDLMSSVKKQNLKRVCVEQCIALVRAYMHAVERVQACKNTATSVAMLRRILRQQAITLTRGPLRIARGFDGAPCIATPELVRRCK